MDLFYCPEISGPEIFLPDDESRHCTRVLRLRKNDEIYLTDGKGMMCRAILLETDPGKTRVKIIETMTDYRKRKYRLHIALAPTKNSERFEWFLEKATEIGIDEITPLICARSERETVNFNRGERILISGIKQAQRAYIPILNPAGHFREILSGGDAKSKIITHCNTRSLPLINERFDRGAPVIILIGPEGDFTMEEVESASAGGFAEASLGPFIYRTETAGIMACHAFNSYFGQ
jgi:16S rRNA (uracil1498-N3)-methyltransferase